MPRSSSAARDWHPGVLGIVASRLARKYHRPTIVIGFDDNGMGKGSGRSIEGLSSGRSVESLLRASWKNLADTRWLPA